MVPPTPNGAKLAEASTEIDTPKLNDLEVPVVNDLDSVTESVLSRLSVYVASFEQPTDVVIPTTFSWSRLGVTFETILIFFA